MIAPSYRDFSSFPWTWWWEKSLIQSCTIFPGQSSFHWPNFASLTFFPLFWSYLFPCLLLQVIRGSLKVVFQSRLVASMFQCFIIFILRFFFQRCYAAMSIADWGGWSRHWEIHLSGSSRGPTKGHFCRRVLTLWLQVMYLVMYLRWFPDILDVEISKSEWDTNLRDEGRGMANLNTFLLF